MKEISDEKIFNAAKHAFGPYFYNIRGWYNIFSNHPLTEEEIKEREEEALSVEVSLVGDLSKNVDRAVLEEMKKAGLV